MLMSDRQTSNQPASDLHDTPIVCLSWQGYTQAHHERHVGVVGIRRRAGRPAREYDVAQLLALVTYLSYTMGHHTCMRDTHYCGRHDANNTNQSHLNTNNGTSW